MHSCLSVLLSLSHIVYICTVLFEQINDDDDDDDDDFPLHCNAAPLRTVRCERTLRSWWRRVLLLVVLLLLLIIEDDG